MGFGGSASVTGEGYRHQGRHAKAAPGGWLRAAALAVLLAPLAAGCSNAPDSDPIAWWRQLEGGKLAEGRVPPPNANAPYPNLATVPTRPQVTDAKSRAQIAAALEVDRRNAEYATTSDPLTPAAAPAPAATPTLPPPGTRPVPPPAPEATMGASMAAAGQTSPTPAPPPAAAAAPPRPAARPATPPPTAPAAAPQPPAPEPAEVVMPTMPDAPPAPPRLPGVAAVTRPVPPRPAPPPTPPAVTPAPGVPVPIAFRPGSAVLPDGASATLLLVAAQRAGRNVWVVGYGESEEDDPATQAAALGLAFSRARAMAGALAQAGVPATAMLMRGEAIGRGGVARIAE